MREELREDGIRGGDSYRVDRPPPLLPVPGPAEPRLREHDRVVQPGEIVDPLDRGASGPEDLREEMVALPERLHLRRPGAASALRSVERLGDNRRRGQKGLEVDDAEETPP